MPRRCKLISPTNLMLEHPILSPVEECEYILLGVKEYRRGLLKIGIFYGLLGMNAGVAIAALVYALRAAR